VHELSVALSLVELAGEHARRLNGARILVLHVRIGRLSGVVKEALEFSFDAAAEGTPVQGARLVIEEVPITVRCADCRADSPVEHPHDVRCPACASSSTTVVGGRELDLAALEVSDGNAAANR